MKRFRIPYSVCVVLTVLLVLGGLIWNNVASCTDLRAKAMMRRTAEGGLDTVLANRGADGMNLSVIAARHLPAEDEDLTALISAARVLQSSDASLQEKHSANEILTARFAAIEQKLAAIEGFDDSRDAVYLRMILTTLVSSDDIAAPALSYNQRAKAYNERLLSPLDGLLSRIFGLMPCELFE